MRFEVSSATLDATLTLPLSTGEYEIPPIDAKTGLILKDRMSLMEEAARRINNGEDAEQVNMELVEKHGVTMEELQSLGEMSLGKELRDQMIEDGVGLRELDMAEMTAFLFHTVADDGMTARHYWETGGKAQAPNRGQRRTATQTRQAAGGTTQKRASATGTKPKGAASKAKASGGQKSSATGTSSK